MAVPVILFYVMCVIFIVLFILMLMYYTWTWPSTQKMYQKLPHPEMFTIFGASFDLFKLENSDILSYLHSLLKNHGPVVHFELLGMHNVLINDPEDVELVLNSSQHMQKGLEYSTLIPWLCEGLLTSTGSKWHIRRKLLTPTFHFKILENFIPVFNRHAKLLTKKLMTADSKDPIDVDSYVSLCTLDVICETAMGTSLNFQLGEASEYVHAIRKAGEIILRRALTFWMFNIIVFKLSPSGREYYRTVKQLHKFTESVIKERKEKYNPDKYSLEETEIGKSKQRKSFLDCLIELQREHPNQISDLGIREEVDTFMFEGHDTTSVAITWALCMIAIHKDVQEKIHEEMMIIFGDSDRDATIHDLHQMNYLEMVIKESLRLYPSVGYLSRYLTADLIIREYVIPRKTNVSIIPFLIHRNPRFFPDPEKFIPERFLPHIAKTRHPYCYIPFSAGYRNCIGQKFALLEEKVIISSIMRKFKLNTNMKKEEIKAAPELVLRPSPKIKITFIPKDRAK